MTAADDLREQVRARYASAPAEVLDADVLDAGADPVPEASAACCASPTEPQPADWFGSSLYAQLQRDDLPVAAVAASLGCGNPTAVAELGVGKRVLDLGSGGGIDVLLSARRVGSTGFVYGVDMTEEMLALARRNKAAAGVTNVEFLLGNIEQLPLPDSCVDVVISNCVINLSTDKPAVLAEMFRVLAPGGRIVISDVVAEDDLTPAERAERGAFTGCIGGALSRQEYLDGLAAVGFSDASVRYTHAAADRMHAAVIRAVKPT